jgi:glycosyltransferase involved in cell wall biosynthesis
MQGCFNAGLRSALAIPLFNKGIGSIITKIPGKIGRKAGLYAMKNIDREDVYSPPRLQIAKLYSLATNPFNIEDIFDAHIAKKIILEEFCPKLLITLQHYMPLTVAAASDRGIRIWSDQISNLSQDTLDRFAIHDATDHTAAESKMAAMNERLLRYATTVSVPSDYVGSAIRTKIAKNSSIYKIPYGVDLVKFFPNSNREKLHANIRIFARANNRRKGGHLLIDALNIVDKKLSTIGSSLQIDVLILGDLSPELKAKLVAASLSKRIKLESKNIPHTDIPVAYRHHDIFVMPTLTEGMSLAIPEAMASGLPVITTPYNGVDELVHGEMGLIHNDSVASLAESLLHAIENRHKWRQWGENGREASSRLTWERYESQFGEYAANAIRNINSI